MLRCTSKPPVLTWPRPQKCKKQKLRKFGPYYAIGILVILGLTQLESRIGKDTVHMIAGVLLVGVLGAIVASKWKTLRR